MLYPVILCGGSGERLWPLSRRDFPKQFTRLTGPLSLFQETVNRLPEGDFTAPIIVTGEAYRFVVRDQMDEIGRSARAILLEPDARNTAPATLAAALYLKAHDPYGIMLIQPSDHMISDDIAYRAVLTAAEVQADAGRIVTLGIQPTRPETGYGYLRIDPTRRKDDVLEVDGFVEKPGLDDVERMLANGDYLWNSGIFIASVRTILKAFQASAPDLVQPVSEALDGATIDLDFLRLQKTPWMRVPAISIDHAIMEKRSDLVTIPLEQGWTDLGDWDAVAREVPSQPDSSDQVTAIDCETSLLRSETDKLELVGIGLTDTIVIAMPDAVLVADQSRSQDVRNAVEILKQKGAPQAKSHQRSHRPWGWFDILATGNGFQVKRLMVAPGAALSLQSHAHRSEHWVIVGGVARVTLDEKTRDFAANQSIYVPARSIHRLENPGPVPLILIEVQTGSYFGEDDIIRYDDAYARAD
ncbi:mannose-1-phosphate guanylyltransferase/mannose-6-phosphate isomerase [Coralliovum pocilloporae]|uniref:mannose-1-phosphate guanylyltransferase/mannose-6-phosphate isomerase n=1 Tax=Coralliovum pocilloporae TaxID=3066369 RepID=UPI003307026C